MILNCMWKKFEIEEINKINSKDFSSLDFDTSNKEILEDLKNVKYNDLEDMVYRMQLTYDEVIGVLDLNIFPQKR